MSVTRPSSRQQNSLDTWAVVLALLIALFVRLGILKTVPW